MESPSDIALVAKLIAEYRNHPKVRLRDQWGKFVERWPWEWFITLTFKDDAHPERAFKLFKVWKNRLNKLIFGPRWHKRPPFGVTWIVAFELQKSGRVHLHALMSGVGQTRRLDAMDDWYSLDELAGFPRIWPVANNCAVSRYVTKYVTKGGDIELSPNLRDISRDLVALAAARAIDPSPERKAPGVALCND